MKQIRGYCQSNFCYTIAGLFLPSSEYTKMAGILEKKFQKAVRRHLPRKEEDSDASDVEFNAKMAREASFNLNSTPRNRQPSRAASSRAKAAIQVAAEEMKVSTSLAKCSPNCVRKNIRNLLIFLVKRR